MIQPNPHFLSQSERESLKALHRKERDKKICDRIKAILLLDNGWSYDILKSLENADLDLAKAPGFELQKSPPYYNMEEISEARIPGLWLGLNPHFQVI